MTTAAHEQWRPALLLTRSFITDYVRNPVNLIMLIIVPLVFVLVAAGSIADAMELLRGRPGLSTQTATAGWAAGFLSGLAMYFQICQARAADKRMLLAGLPPRRLLAGLPPRRLLAARAGTGLLMAVLVSAVALVALTVRTGIDHPGRVIIGTLMFALIYLAIGALVGVAVSNPVNGAVVILLI
nr:ABC transporter permease [Mycobacterium nebraskense]